VNTPIRNQENSMAKDLTNQNVSTEEIATALGHELERLQKHWWWLLLLGVLLVIGGIVALAYPFATETGVMLVFGAVLIIAGVATVIGAFWAGKWSAFFLQVLVGILYVMAGMVIRDVPLESIALLTMFIAASFIVVGVFRVVVALHERFPQWGWALLNGLVTMIAGLIIYDTYPTSALWVIGLLIGLELLFNGLTWIMLALALRAIPDQELAEG
jgi:uncharacterized membrane protein HdeD (DUF308 family)